VDRENLLHGFEFDQEAVFNEEVEAQGFVEGVALVFDGDDFLVYAVDGAQGEFADDALFVNGFDEARALEAVNFDGRAYDFVGEFVGFYKKGMHGGSFYKRADFYRRIFFTEGNEGNEGRAG
jgi:hypothetical protein